MKILHIPLFLSPSLYPTVPPSVRAIPTSGQLQARKGGPITLECKGSGNPVPSIYWTKKVCFFLSHSLPVLSLSL